MAQEAPDKPSRKVDRRRHPRFPIRMRVMIERFQNPLIEDSQKRLQVEITDISKSGIRYRCRELTYPKERIRTCLNAAGGDLFVDCIYEVVRVQRMSRSYECGAKLVRKLP